MIKKVISLIEGDFILPIELDRTELEKIDLEAFSARMKNYIDGSHPQSGIEAVLGGKKIFPHYEVTNGNIRRGGVSHEDAKLCSVLEFLRGNTYNLNDDRAINLVYKAIMHYASTDMAKTILFALPVTYYKVKYNNALFACIEEATIAIYKAMENILFEMYKEITEGQTISDEMVKDKLLSIVFKADNIQNKESFAETETNLQKSDNSNGSSNGSSNDTEHDKDEKAYCASCGHIAFPELTQQAHVGRNVKNTLNTEELKETRRGYYCSSCDAIICSFCVTFDGDKALCKLCGKPAETQTIAKKKKRPVKKLAIAGGVFILVVLSVTLLYVNSDKYELRKLEAAANAMPLAEAASLYEEALPYAEGWDDNERIMKKIVEAHLAKASQYIEQKDWVNAQQEISNTDKYFTWVDSDMQQQILDGSSDIKKLQAQGLFDDGYYGEAALLFDELEDYDKSVECYENSGEWGKLADIFRQKQDWDKAAQYYEKSESWLECAQMYTEHEDWKSAAYYYEKANDLYEAANAYEKSGDLETAAEYFEKVSSWNRAKEIYLALDKSIDAEYCRRMELQTYPKIFLAFLGQSNSSGLLDDDIRFTGSIINSSLFAISELTIELNVWENKPSESLYKETETPYTKRITIYDIPVKLLLTNEATNFSEPVLLPDKYYNKDIWYKYSIVDLKWDHYIKIPKTNTKIENY